MKTFIVVLLLFIIIAVVSCKSIYVGKQYEILKLSTISELDSLSLLNFTVMSDNHGYSTENLRFKKMFDFTKKANADFVIGVGDHVKPNNKNKFLELLREDEFWHNNFYPVIADGENEVFGKGQWDWGEGKELFEFINLESVKNKREVVFNENGAEYYVQLFIENITLHLIQLHFPDEPHDTGVSFKQESRDYMIEIIKAINKTKNDIIIVSAHSMTGFWHHLLSREELEILLDKADMLFSATTHIYDRALDPLYGDRGAFIFNTGSVCLPLLFSPPGYVKVNVLDKPRAIVLQYIDLNKDNYDFADEGFAFIKYMNNNNKRGRIMPLIFQKGN